MVPLAEFPDLGQQPNDSLLLMDVALTRLGQSELLQVRLIEMRYFERHDTIHILIKVGAQCDGPTIDARHDLAAEERLPACQRQCSLISATARRTRSERGSTPKSCSIWRRDDTLPAAVGYVISDTSICKPALADFDNHLGRLVPASASAFSPALAAPRIPSTRYWFPS